jgi:hypothetical protein
MNEPVTTEDIGEAIKGQRNGLAVYREAQADAIARYSDAQVNIEKSENELHALETAMHNDQMKHERLNRYLDYQRKRKVALERKIIAGREFIRSAEDEDLGL